MNSLAAKTKTEPVDPGKTLKIFFLPNLMTAGNLFCGFIALTKIVEADPDALNFQHTIKMALAFILLACIFDLLDGRVARWGGAESPFGREFDSLADIISFGAAPAFLVHRIVLKDVFARHPEIGWFIASVYLICGALRLARFNCLATTPGGGGGKEFLGFPIPAAAGMVASLTLLMLWIQEPAVLVGDESKTELTNSVTVVQPTQAVAKGVLKIPAWRSFISPDKPAKRNRWRDVLEQHTTWRYGLPILMLFLSFMMVSEVKYPTFKSLNLKAKRTFTKFVYAVLFIGCLLILREKILYAVLPVLFTSYLIYGFVRPWLPYHTREEIEEEEDDEENENLTAANG